MARELIHEQVAAYALDALDDSERRDFEEHLATCEQCREELEGLRDAAVALAYVPEGPAPPPALRDRVLKGVHDDRAPNVVPLARRRFALPAVATFAVAAAAAAIVLAVWASSLSSSLDHKTAISQVLASGNRMRLAGGMEVAVAGEKAVVVSALGAAPPGKTFELWVIQNGTARSAGLFNYASPITPILLSRNVPKGARIGVSVEPAGGSPRPTRIIGETTPI